jgi:hypothetical protein
MAASSEEGTEMKWKKRFTIKMVALGFAAIAISVAPAQARLDEGLGVPKAGEPTFSVSPDDRAVSRMAPTQIQTSIVSPDDRAVSRVSPTPSQPTVISNDDGFELGTLSTTGIVLLLAAGATLIVVYQGRKGRLASA